MFFLTARALPSTFTRAFDGSEQCGDFVERIDLGNGTWFAVMGDIAGRGNDASVAARRLHAYVRSLVCRNASLCEIVEECNAFYERSLMNDVTPFASMVVARVTDGDSVLAYVSAGHETALLIEKARHVHLATTGPLLGLQLGREAVFREASSPIENDSLLVLATDGITDARRRGRGPEVIFGSCGVVKAVMRRRDACADLSREVYTSAADHARGDLADDASVLVAPLRALALAPAHRA